MKRILLATLLALAYSASAFATDKYNPYEGMTDKDMQKIQEGAMEMMKCVQDAGGQELLDRIAAQGQAMNVKLAELCKAGKRDEAEKEALVFGEEMSKGTDTQKIMKCGEMGKQMLEATNFKLPEPKDGKTLHLCDAY